MKIKKNKPLLAILLGMVVIIPVEIYTLVFKYFGIIDISAFEYTSLIVSREPIWELGFLTAPGIAGIATLILYYSSIILDIDFFPLKGAFVGSIAYSFIAIISLFTGFNMTTLGHFIHASSGFLGGLLAGFLVKKYLLNQDAIETNRSSDKPVKYRLVPTPSLRPKQEKRIKGRKLIKPKKL